MMLVFFNYFLFFSRKSCYSNFVDNFQQLHIMNLSNGIHTIKSSWLYIHADVDVSQREFLIAEMKLDEYKHVLGMCWIKRVRKRERETMGELGWGWLVSWSELWMRSFVELIERIEARMSSTLSQSETKQFYTFSQQYKGVMYNIKMMQKTSL